MTDNQGDAPPKSAPDTIPDAALVAATAREVGLTIADVCMPGVLANRALLRRYADLVHGFALPDTCEPAFEYRP
ncbi:conserved hypothetical protein [Gluconacetobacter diazotrophicus PA1 5]|uniref:Uncharacterized protein n=2 Tax=Gluconacetobacter diazotrophicus TaxID=33996 RepID=A9HJR9_GLUDA|nr:DUF4089 domain-containing protein [Gluconacetobacter diazotrophicus]ACI50018.1 conserved hypothetical protein [Gluconacetobacter diazotrophicus PA1 5]MBB2156288.1 DUF4089 domain-containing protein [Gluconacetobacter diazotrophicus]TWB07902.1 uncharacterized protein DUF4089 [Gluconacetobacter diazotrophicus]CAP55941.1 hypothetical protein GDI1998 [Gluconacetobacter diazotrophicus PA1 5]